VVRFLLAVFLVSGLAGLIYQVAWQRLLTVHLGVGAISIALTVSVYMFGLGLGSLLGGRLAGRFKNPVALYALLEFTLGIVGLASFPAIQALGRFTAGAAPAVSFLCLFAFLSLPTLLMGMTLPLVTSIFAGLSRGFVYSVSHLYFCNTLGAAVGAVLTGYVLVSLLGLDGCIYLAAGINLFLAAAILRSRRAARTSMRLVNEGDPEPEAGHGWGYWAYLLVFVTGFVAIGFEIIGYRVIGVLVKDSPYAFSSVLSVYLLGIACGSLATRRLAPASTARRRDLFLGIQFFMGLTVLLTFTGYFYLCHLPPLRALNRLSFTAELHPSPALFTEGLGMHSMGDAFLLLDVFFWPFVFLFVPALFMGASFPLISSLAPRRTGGEGRAVGTTFFYGVLGNVSGGLLTGLVLLPAAGTERTLLIFGLAGTLFGMARFSQQVSSLGVAPPIPPLYRRAAVLVLCAAFIAIFPAPGEFYAALHIPPFPPESVHFEEGLDAVVLTYEKGDRLRNYINGQGHGYRPGPVFIAEAVAGLSHTPSPEEVLVIGFGAGSIAEASLSCTEVRQVTVIELCRSVVRNLRKSAVCAAILDDERVWLVVDDGRRFLARTDKRFDLILMDPSRTTSAYSNNLHSRQFFALAGQHLTPGGILMVGGLDDYRTIARTLLEEYEYVRAYPNFCLASSAPLHQNRLRFDRLLHSLSADLQAAIRELDWEALEGPPLRRQTAGYPVNEDRRPVSEYYLGLRFRRWLASGPSLLRRPIHPP
jgi:spermidine synthase